MIQRLLSLFFVLGVFGSGCLASLALWADGQARDVEKPLWVAANFVQGGVAIGKIDAGGEVFLNDQPLRLSKDNYFVVGFDRDAKPGDVLLLRDKDGLESRQILEITSRQYNIQRIEGIEKRIMQPDKQDLQRIRKENLLVTKARRQDLDRSDFNKVFKWPLIGAVTGVFGSQRVYNGEPRRPHYGVDVAASTGTLVRAPAPGLVTLAHPDMFYSGGTLIIDHGHGISSSFLHLSEILVKVGDIIVQGDPIAKVGATGRATGSHLDWRMNWFKRRIDPQLLVQKMPVLTGKMLTGKRQPE